MCFIFCALYGREEILLDWSRNVVCVYGDGNKSCGGDISGRWYDGSVNGTMSREYRGLKHEFHVNTKRTRRCSQCNFE